LALADEEGVDRFHVVGHDWGGAVAWQLAATHADRLLTMTSLATPHPQAMVRSLLRGRFFRRQLVDSGMPDDYVDEVFRHQLVDKTSTIW
jgi:pimeloyl-ACP methyl ester carboxylesterase